MFISSARRTLHSSLGFTSLTLVVVCSAACCGAEPKPSEPLITPSKATTHVVAPLDAEGYVDFIAASVEEFGRGVAPSENAFVGLLEALGPAENNVAFHNILRTTMGLPEWHSGDLQFLNSPEATGIDAAPPSSDESLRQQQRASVQPWVESDCPLVAAWISRNEVSLKKVTEAVRKPKYFRPLVRNRPDDLFIAILLPDVQTSRAVARQLKMRAMLHLGHGRLQEARDDLLTIHRLGSHIGHGASLIEGLVGIAIDAIATQGDNIWAIQSNVTSEQLTAYSAELATLPAPCDLGRSIDLGERLMVLDFAQGMARGRTQASAALGDAVLPGFDVDKLARTLTLLSVDWNASLNSLNGVFDELVTFTRLADRRQRVAAFAAFEQKLAASKTRAVSARSVVTNILGGSEARGKSLGDVLASLLVPAVSQAYLAQDRALQRRQLLILGLQIQEYRVRTGTYPLSLDELSLKSATTDLFSGRPLLYDATGETFQLYSIGPNSRDDGGSATPSSSQNDDLVFSNPPQP